MVLLNDRIKKGFIPSRHHMYQMYQFSQETASDFFIEDPPGLVVAVYTGLFPGQSFPQFLHSFSLFLSFLSSNSNLSTFLKFCFEDRILPPQEFSRVICWATTSKSLKYIHCSNNRLSSLQKCLEISRVNSLCRSGFIIICTSMP